MTSIAIDRTAGLSSSTAIKGPVACATTANVTLAGEQTIDGVTTSESRVLVKNQTTTADNGIYLTSTGDWTREPDFSRNDDVVNGTLVSVAGGSANAAHIYSVSFTGDLSIGTTSLTITDVTPAVYASKRANIASAATVTVASNAFQHITGTVTITDIDFSPATDGAWALVEFDGALTLTHNGTTLTLPGGVNITTAAGDRMLVVQDSSDNAHVLFYQPYAPVPNTLNGQYKFPAIQNASSDANTLDDYEESTFTVTAAFATVGTSSWSYASQSGVITKIGNSGNVLYLMSFTPTIGTGSGTMTLSGFPYSPTNAFYGAVSELGVPWSWSAGRTMIVSKMNASSGDVTLQQEGTAVAVAYAAAANMTTATSHLFRTCVPALQLA